MITVWIIILLIIIVLIIPFKFEYLYNSNNGLSVNIYLVKIFNIKFKIKKKKNDYNLIYKIKSFYLNIKNYNENKEKYKKILQICYLDNIIIDYTLKDIYSYVFINSFIEYIDNELNKMFNKKTLNNYFDKSYNLKLGNKNKGEIKISIYFRLIYILFLLINDFKILSVITLKKKKGDVVGTNN